VASDSTSFTNASIADTALKYVGEWGGEACRDAKRSGLTGSTQNYPVQPTRRKTGKVTKEGDGQCRAFVNCVVWIASGHTQWLGGSYFSAFTKAGGKEITKTDNLAKGDIVQIGEGVHTLIIVKRVEGSTFSVVDSNHDYKETVMNYHRTLSLGTRVRAFRMGRLDGGKRRSGSDFLLRVTADRKARLGSWTLPPSGSYASAIRAYGLPSTCDVTSESREIFADWRRLPAGWVFRLADGVPVPTAYQVCRGSAVSAVFDRGGCLDRRCVTAEGLRFGDPVAKLLRLYPNASSHYEMNELRYWLVTTPEGDPLLFASTGNGVVNAFFVNLHLWR
jgi:hypothetical protein